ncbi:SSI family serine proteinase inhibitor [Streptomyces sp. NPDC005931]|uniref:SSI family serine proteinase inhibitor n=1 Tax=Streptomyces sp. NPDC005931 TaxID=3364737 RepID=UPI0036860900
MSHSIRRIRRRGAARPAPQPAPRHRAGHAAPLTVRAALRRFAVVAVAFTASLTGVASLSAAPAAAGPPTPRHDRHHLTVTVRDAGGGTDGTYEVYCRPGGGSHPDPRGACAAVERNTRWGRDAFAPAPDDRVCSMQYGGPATARVTGTWAGRPVDATYSRVDGCEIARWDGLVPLLPDLRPAAPGPTG